MKMFRLESRAIEIILIVLFALLFLAAYQNQGIREKFFAPESGLVRAVRSLRTVAYFGRPARKYGITRETTTVELAKMLSDLLLQDTRDERQLRIIIKELHKRADLVLRGVIDNIHTVDLTNDYDVEGEFSVSIAVKTVERGEFDRDLIDVSSGYYASWLPFPVYPSYIKINYRRGDKVRVYVENDPDFGYIISGGFFGIESLGEY